MCFTTLCKESGQTALSHFLKRNFIGCPPILNTRLDHNTWNYCDFPTLCKKHMSSLTFPANQYREGTGEGAYDLLSLSKKTTTSNHLQCHNIRQHILLSNFKTLSVGPVTGSKLSTSHGDKGNV